MLKALIKMFEGFLFLIDKICGKKEEGCGCHGTGAREAQMMGPKLKMDVPCHCSAGDTAIFGHPDHPGKIFDGIEMRKLLAAGKPLKPRQQPSLVSLRTAFSSIFPFVQTPPS